MRYLLISLFLLIPSVAQARTIINLPHKVDHMRVYKSPHIKKSYWYVDTRYDRRTLVVVKKTKPPKKENFKLPPIKFSQPTRQSYQPPKYDPITIINPYVE